MGVDTLAGLRRHQVARIEPEMFCQGPKMAGAKAACRLFSVFMASEEAKPPFCIPTSNATVRHQLSSSRANRASQ